MGDATVILSAIEQGDEKASEQLLPLLYDELRRLAARFRPGEARTDAASDGPRSRSFSATGRRQPGPKLEQPPAFFRGRGRGHAEDLVDNARRKRRLKHGGDRNRIELDAACSFDEGRADELLALQEALEKLEAESPEKAELVKLRYFGGLPHQEAAETLGISRATADRYWAYARAFLYSAIDDARAS